MSHCRTCLRQWGLKTYHNRNLPSFCRGWTKFMFPLEWSGKNCSIFSPPKNCCENKKFFFIFYYTWSGKKLYSLPRWGLKMYHNRKLPSSCRGWTNSYSLWNGLENIVLFSLPQKTAVKTVFFTFYFTWSGKKCYSLPPPPPPPPPSLLFLQKRFQEKQRNFFSTIHHCTIV